MKPRRLLVWLAVACALPAAAAAAPEASSQAPATASATPTPAMAAATPMAVVNGRTITLQDFERAFTTVARQKFYHRAAPEGQLEQARREVAESLVDRALLLQEAHKRGVGADDAAIDKTLDGYEKQYASSPNWKAMRERVLPELRRELGDQQRLAKLEASVRDTGAPKAEAVRAFYDANPALFTEPERAHLSVILLKVDPSAPKAVRDKARDEGRELRERVAKGADFAQLAKIHSADDSAPKGGDLGYLHRGMLGEAIQKVVDELKPGELSASFDVLEGVAIFKLHERSAPRLRDYESVKARAEDLLKREQSERAWKDLIAELRRGGVIERIAPPFAAPPTEGARGKDTAWAAKDGARGP